MNGPPQQSSFERFSPYRLNSSATPSVSVYRFESGRVIAGPEGKLWRGFSEDCSARAFGHMGADGQISWADPKTGLCFVFLTNGAQKNAARQGANGFRLSTLAAACATHE